VSRKIIAAFALIAIASTAVWAFRTYGSAEVLARVENSILKSSGATKTSTSRREPRAPVTVSVAIAASENVPIHLSSIGTVQAYNTVNVRPRVDGEIVKIVFREGDDVRGGDVLAIIDPRPFEAQLRQQEANRRRTAAQLQGAELDLRRAETLVQKSFASQQQVDQLRAQVDAYRAQLLSDEAQIEYAKTLLEYTSVRAPIDGRAGIRQVDQGNMIRSAENMTITVLTQLKPISVIFSISSTLAARNKLELGRANLPATALDSDGVTVLDRGTVELVDNLVDPTTGTVKVKASFPNEQLRLWPGNFVNGRIQVDMRPRAVTVPWAAVRSGPRGEFVWIVKDDRTVEVRGVAARAGAPGRALVERGLRAGERVVTEGHFLLENGATVEIAPTAPPQSPPTPRVASEAG